jgi:hypothetical protein
MVPLTGNPDYSTDNLLTYLGLDPEDVKVICPPASESPTKEAIVKSRKLTVSRIRDELTRQGVTFKATLKKPELVELLDLSALSEEFQP